MTFIYHPPTVDSLDIEPSSDGLGVRIGIYNAADNGTYTTIEVVNRDVEKVIQALLEAKVGGGFEVLDHHDDFVCSENAMCHDCVSSGDQP